MTGHVSIVGLGPGGPEHTTPAASNALAAATDLVGYGPYLERVTAGPQQTKHPSDNRVEIERARTALEFARAGRQVAIVSSGDAGVFAMAATVFEAIEQDPQAFSAIDVTVIPGVTAMVAAAARLGAPLGHDFCAISLSDNLKPWDVIVERLKAAAGAGFVIALYNPASKSRPRQLNEALEILRGILPGETLVAFETAISRPEEQIVLSTLADADPGCADMRTLVMIGSEATRQLTMSDGTSWVYTPRRAETSL